MVVALRHVSNTTITFPKTLIQFGRPPLTTSTVCDICNGQKDKPHKVTLLWVGTAGSTTSITFSSDSTCVKPTQLTSNSATNEVVLDASTCSGYSDKLSTNVQLTVDGSSKYLHASCSQPINTADVVYKNAKGSLILVGFEATSGRTEHDCGGRFTTTPAPTTSTAPCENWCAKKVKTHVSWSTVCTYKACGGCPVCSAKPGH